MRGCSPGAARDNSAGVTATAVLVFVPGAAAKARSSDGGERLRFHPHTDNPLRSVALNSLATPSSLTKTLKWLLFWLDCRYLKHLSTLLSVPESHFNSLCLPTPARRQPLMWGTQNTEGTQPAFGTCWTWAAVGAAMNNDPPGRPEKAQIGPDGW